MLYLRAIVIDNGEAMEVLIGGDPGGMNEEVWAETVQRISDEHGISAETGLRRWHRRPVGAVRCRPLLDQLHAQRRSQLSGVPEWPACTPESGATMIFDDYSTLREAHDAEFVRLYRDEAQN